MRICHLPVTVLGAEHTAVNKTMSLPLGSLCVGGGGVRKKTRQPGKPRQVAMSAKQERFIRERSYKMLGEGSIKF